MKYLALLLVIPLSNLVSGQRTEIKVYNQLYTQDATYDDDGDKVDDDVRMTFLTNIIEFNLKQDAKRSWWGFEAYIRASRQHEVDDSPFEALSYENNNQDARAGLSHLGVKWHWRPIAKEKGLYLKNLFLVPLNNTTPPTSGDVPFLDDTGYQYFLQLNYSHQISEKLFGYYEFGGWWRFERKVEPSSDFLLPAKAFITYFPASGVGLYGFTTLLPTLSSPTNHVVQVGGGVKVFPDKKWTLELGAGAFPIGRNAGAGYNIDLSVTYAWDRSKKDGK